MITVAYAALLGWLAAGFGYAIAKTYRVKPRKPPANVFEWIKYQREDGVIDEEGAEAVIDLLFEDEAIELRYK